jgi:hypothetical protein
MSKHHLLVRQRARQQIAGVKDITRIHLVTYCIASDQCWACFAVPPNDPQRGYEILESRNVSVHFFRDATNPCVVGQWYTLAYVVTQSEGSSSGMWYVIDLSDKRRRKKR